VLWADAMAEADICAFDPDAAPNGHGFDAAPDDETGATVRVWACFTLTLVILATNLLMNCGDPSRLSEVAKSKDMPMF